jgi:excisionase family DNA binding protein
MGEHELTISVPAAGRRLGIGKNLSYAAARRGELPVLRFGRKLRVPLAALDRLLAATGSKAEVMEPNDMPSVDERIARQEDASLADLPKGV